MYFRLILPLVVGDKNSRVAATYRKTKRGQASYKVDQRCGQQPTGFGWHNI